MTLGERQRLFTRLAAEMILEAYGMGYEMTFGDAFRDPRLHGFMGQKKGYGHASSLHKARLAIDLCLFKDGQYLVHTEDYAPIGEIWKPKHHLARWGGDFSDGNHFSMEYNGIK